MTKAFSQLLILVALFFATWWCFSRIDFVKHFHLAKVSEKAEQKLGEAIIKSIDGNEIASDSALIVLNKIKTIILEANPAIPKDIQLHLIRNKDVNAFAIPGHHIIVYSNLIKKCDSAGELAGVMSHEMAHIELNHVMKMIVSQLGIGVVASVTAGNSAVVNEILQKLSTTAFERKQETAADMAGLQYLQNAHINPAGMASFMNKMATMQKDQPEIMEWISTHPDPQKRAQAIADAANSLTGTYTELITPHEWQILKDATATR